MGKKYNLSNIAFDFDDDSLAHADSNNCIYIYENTIICTKHMNSFSMHIYVYVENISMTHGQNT